MNKIKKVVYISFVTFSVEAIGIISFYSQFLTNCLKFVTKLILQSTFYVYNNFSCSNTISNSYFFANSTV